VIETLLGRQRFDSALHIRPFRRAADLLFFEVRVGLHEFARLEQRYKSAPAWEKLKSQTANLLEKIQANEDKMIQSRSKSTEGFVRFPVMLDEQLIYLNWSVDSTDAAPTDGQQQLFTQLSEKLQEQLNTWDAFLSRDLPAFNRAAGSAKIPVVEVRGK
jgi:hypothetical protein